MFETLKDLFSFMKENKKFWMIPFLVVLLLFGALIVFSQGSPLAPFVYTMF